MGTAYRDAARLVSRAIIDNNGKNSLREGFFDNLLEMDKMPVSGMSMTYGSDSVVPDSANTGTAWASGNKSYLNAVNSFADGTVVIGGLRAHPTWQVPRTCRITRASRTCGST